MANKPHFPMFVNLTGKQVLVIGAGTIAKRRIKTLTEFADCITVVSENFSDEVLDLEVAGKITCRTMSFKVEYLNLPEFKADLVFGLTDNHQLNADIAAYCTEHFVPVNISTDKSKCSFYFPGVVLQDETVIGITASGKDHKKAKFTREKIEKLMKTQKIVVGSRESKLAVIQSEMVIDYLKENHPEVETQLLTMKTTGDIILDRALDKIGGKGLFIKELDLALVEERSDLSVHSLKDMPMEVPDELPLIGYSKREDPRDVLILPVGATEIDFSKPIGCGSLRRILQLQDLYPEATFKNVRGNVITRLAKLDSGEYSALILAAAGVKRLGLEERISKYFTVKESLPAAGQGIVALQGRKGVDYSCLAGFCDETAEYQAVAERAFVRTLDGGCSSPIAAHAIVDGDHLVLEGLYYNEDTKVYTKDSISGKVHDADAMGVELANRMKNA